MSKTGGIEEYSVIRAAIVTEIHQRFRDDTDAEKALGLSDLKDPVTRMRFSDNWTAIYSPENVARFGFNPAAREPLKTSAKQIPVYLPIAYGICIPTVHIDANKVDEAATEIRIHDIKKRLSQLVFRCYAKELGGNVSTDVLPIDVLHTYEQQGPLMQGQDVAASNKVQISVQWNLKFMQKGCR